MKGKEECERASLKLNIKKKTKIMLSDPVTSWQREGEGGSSDRFPLVSKVTQMVTAAMRSEDVCILAGKLWQT